MAQTLQQIADELLFDFLAPGVTPTAIVQASAKHLDGLSAGQQVNVLARITGQLIALLRLQDTNPRSRKRMTKFRNQLRTTTSPPETKE